MLNIFEDLQKQETPPAQPPVQQVDVAQLVRQELANRDAQSAIAQKQSELSALKTKVDRGDVNRGEGYIDAAGKYDVFSHNIDKNRITQLEREIAQLSQSVPQVSAPQSQPTMDDQTRNLIISTAKKVVADNSAFVSATILPKAKQYFQEAINKVNWAQLSFSPEVLEQSLDNMFLAAKGNAERDAHRAQQSNNIPSGEQKPASNDPYAEMSEAEKFMLKQAGDKNLANWKPSWQQV
jgi:hypothetical protein